MPPGSSLIKEEEVTAGQPLDTSARLQQQKETQTLFIKACTKASKGRDENIR